MYSGSAKKKPDIKLTIYVKKNTKRGKDRISELSALLEQTRLWLYIKSMKLSNMLHRTKKISLEIRNKQRVYDSTNHFRVVWSMQLRIKMKKRGANNNLFEKNLQALPFFKTPT